MQAIYISSNQFKVSTDKTEEFLAGRRIRALCGSEYKYSTVQSSTYSSPDTTVTIEDSELTSNLSEVHYGIVNIGEQGSFPNHSHDGTEGTGGALSLLTLSDTPDIYEEGEYLRSTTSGVEWIIPEAEAIIIKVKEEDISAITKGQACTIVGSSGVKSEVGLCDCDDPNKIRIIGLAQTDISQNEDGIVVYKGVLTNVDTRTTNSGINPNGETWVSEDLLWVSNIPGGLTKNRPTSGRSIKAARTVKGNSATDTLIVISHENTTWSTAASGEDVVLRVGDSVGANKVSIRAYNNNEVAVFDSYGNLTVSGTVDGVDVATFKSDFDTKVTWYLTDGVPASSFGRGNDIAINQNIGTMYKKITVLEGADIFYPVAGGDDGYSSLQYGFNSSSVIFMLGNQFQPANIFVRFPGINIPQGATITEAYVKFTAHSDLSSNTCSVNCYFNDIDDATAPIDTAEFDALILTDAVAWNALPGWVDGVQYDTPSIVSILQAVTDRAGWVDGNALQIILKDNNSDTSAYRHASSINYLSGAEKAELHVAWTSVLAGYWEEKLSPDFLKLLDTPTTYSGGSGKYLKTTNSGIEFVDDLYTKSEVDTISGTLQTNIDGKADTVHIHDDRYYTESEVDTISGTLQTSIDSMPVTLLELADTPTTYSGSVGKYLKTTSSGVIFSDIDSEYWESVDVFLDENYSNDKGLPTQVERGLFKGYSMPIWSTPANQYEELVFRIRAPFRWDGVTNPTFMMLVSISATEDVGDKFKFQMEWESKGVSNVIPDTTAEVLTDEVAVTDGTAYYSYLASASLDSAKLIHGDNLQFRVRRVAATDPQVNNEIIVWHWDSRWKMNKLGTVSE